MRSRKPGRANRILEVCIGLTLAWMAPSAHAEPWAQHKDRLPSLARKLEENEAAIRHLLEEKEHAHDPNQVAEIMNQLIEKHRQLATVSKDYEEERLHVRFKHPDLASVLERRYKHFKLRSIDEIGAQAGIDGKLDRLKAKVAVTFPVLKQDSLSGEEHAREPASVGEDDYDRADRITLSK